MAPARERSGARAPGRHVPAGIRAGVGPARLGRPAGAGAGGVGVPGRGRGRGPRGGTRGGASVVQRRAA
ncbi:hypothetical protein D7W81_35755 [Corallococcus aberystwythensis]|uniref:Uncharacterized protein n=1 Tax=Corallococcus aberystwythensis TaxID=2316722 RepID=A0A3A8PKA1_9BACT|nr:hypothetical protein D7W81_35755 [Corallococcus aberystwythensis]